MPAQLDRALYIGGKFAGRHLIAVLGATPAWLSVALIVATTSVSLFQAHEARRQAEKATAIKNFLLHVFTAGDNRAAGSKPPAEVTALELLDEGSAELVGALDTQPAVKLELIENMGDIYERLDAIDKEMALYRLGIHWLTPATDRIASKGNDSGYSSQDRCRLAGQVAESEKAVAEAERAFDASGDHRSLYYAHLLKTKGGLLAAGPRAKRSGRGARHVEAGGGDFARRYPDDEGYVSALISQGAEMALDEAHEAEDAADRALLVTRRLNEDATEQAHAVFAACFDQETNWATPRASATGLCRGLETLCVQRRRQAFLLFAERELARTGAAAEWTA